MSAPNKNLTDLECLLLKAHDLTGPNLNLAPDVYKDVIRRLLPLVFSRPIPDRAALARLIDPDAFDLGQWGPTPHSEAERMERVGKAFRGADRILRAGSAS